MSPQQEKAMRVKGLECLVSILKCLVEWCHDLYINPATTGLNAVTNIGQGSSLVGEPIPSEKRVDIDQAEEALTHSKDTLRRGHTRDGSMTLSYPVVYQDHLGSGQELSTSQTSLNSATDDPEQFESQRQRKEIIEHGMTL